jgi:hypothetical protein
LLALGAPASAQKLLCRNCFQSPAALTIMITADDDGWIHGS